MGSEAIPYPIIAMMAQLFDDHYTRKEIVRLFHGSDAPGEEPPDLNKVQTVIEWLKVVNRVSSHPRVVLGRLLEDFFDGAPSSRGTTPETLAVDRERLRAKLASYGLRYSRGTIVAAAGTAATRSLQSLLRARDFPAVLAEFDRATENVESEPREAASAAANILEAICKEYIVQHPALPAPKKKDLSPIFEVVRSDLGLDPASVEDEDLRRVLGGLASIVEGIAAFRTHASSAHAQNTSKRQYRMTPRHARLAVGAAHVVVAFIIETWEQRMSKA